MFSDRCGRTGTRGRTEAVSVKDAVLMGLATDGGLLLPRTIPDVTDRLETWRTLSYSELAFEVIRLFNSPSMDIQVASKFERYRYFHTGRDPEAVCRLMDAFRRTGTIELAQPDPLFAAGFPIHQY